MSPGKNEKQLKPLQSTNAKEKDLLHQQMGHFYLFKETQKTEKYCPKSFFCSMFMVRKKKFFAMFQNLVLGTL